MKKRLFAILIATATLLCALSITALADDPWDGSVYTSWYNDTATEFTIGSAADLAGLAKLVNDGTSFSGKTITLTADIDLAGKEWTPIGTKDKPFQGTFDGTKVMGDGGAVTEVYTISNLTVNGTGYLGLFGATNGATLKNFTLSSVNVTGSSDHVAAIAGKTSGTTITNVTVQTASVTSTKTSYAYVGGLTGEGYTGTIENCVVDGLKLVAKGSFIGGISSQGYAKINNCTVENSSITSSDWKVGGIIGQLNEGAFAFTGNQVLDTTITSTSSLGSVGGLIGFSNYGNKTLTDNTVRNVTINSSTGGGGLIGSISSQTGNTFTFNDCEVVDLTFESEGKITSSGGLVGEEYWRTSSGTTVTASGCTVSGVKLDAADGSKAGALFGEFASGGNTYTVTNVNVTAGDAENAVSQLIGDSTLGSSTFTINTANGGNTVLDAVYAGEAVDYLEDGFVLEKNGDGSYGLGSPTGQTKVAFNRDQLTYYTSLSAAFTAAKNGDRILVLAADTSGTTAELTVSVTLEPGSYALPAITVEAGANLTLSGSSVLNAALTNNGTVTVDQSTTVTRYYGDGALATNLTGKRVRAAGNVLELYNIPYVFEINGVKYEAEQMADMAASIGASWNSDSSTLTLGRDVSITGTVGVMQTMTLELNGFQLDWPAESNTGNPLIVVESGFALTVQDSSAAQTGSLVAGKSNVFQGYGRIILKSGTVEAKNSDIYYALSNSEGLYIEGGTIVVPKGKAIVSSDRASYVNITGGTFNVLPAQSSVENGYVVVKLGGVYKAFAESQLESGIDHGAEIAAQVGEKYYATLAGAIDAAKVDGTVELLRDVEVETWQQVWNVDGMTIDGNGHTVTVGSIESKSNGDYLFFRAKDLYIHDITFNVLEGNGICITSGKLERVTMIDSGSNAHAVFVYTKDADDDKVEIIDCKFENFGTAIYSQPGAAGSVTTDTTVSGCTFDGCRLLMCIYAENTVFTDNVVNGATELSFAGGANAVTTVTGNTFNDAGKIWFYQADLGKVTFEKNKVLGNTYVSTEQADGNTTLDVDKNYWGGGAPSSSQVRGGNVTGKDVYYVAPGMNESDLNTYAPYTVTIVYGNGQANDVTNHKLNDQIQLPAAPTKSGYIFMGWKCGGEVYAASETVTVTGNMTFYAVWANMPDVGPTVPDEPVKFPFTDVSAGSWYYDAVYYVWENGLMNGTDTYKFSPNSPLTRAMVWAVLARIDGVKIEGDTWMTDAQKWAVAKGVSDGTNPTGYITREQLVTMLWRYKGSPAVEYTLTAPDAASISDWAVDAMKWAASTGLIEGDETGALNPASNSTRAHAATFFMRFCK